LLRTDNCFQAISMRAPVASNTAQRIRLSQGLEPACLSRNPTVLPGPSQSKCTNQMDINIVHAKVQKTRYTRENEGMNYVGAHHDLWLKL